MKAHIFLGKGGVGKSTLAVALASILPKSCVISIDQQQNHVDIIKKNELNVEYGTLHNEVTDNIMKILKALGFNGFKDVAPMIAQDFIVMTQLAYSIYDYRLSIENIVIDYPPNCNSINLLYMPNALESTVAKILTLRQRVKRLITGHDETMELLDEYQERLFFLGDVLRNADIYCLGIPTELGFIECEKAYQTCVKNCLNVKGFINNMVNDSLCGCEYCLMYRDNQYQVKDKYIGLAADSGISYHEILYSNRFSVIREQLKKIINK